MDSIANILLSTGLDRFVNTHDWVWPVCEILHFFGMAALIGTVGVIDLRILGAAKGIRIATLERFVPLGIAGFILNLLTGIIFVAGNPIGGPLDYLENLAFQIKMVLILIAGLNLLLYYFLGIARRTDALAPEQAASSGAKVVAAVSVFAWFSVIVFGRLIMYNDTLLWTLGL